MGLKYWKECSSATRELRCTPTRLGEDANETALATTTRKGSLGFDATDAAGI